MSESSSSVMQTPAAPHKWRPAPSADDMGEGVTHTEPEPVYMHQSPYYMAPGGSSEGTQITELTLPPIEPPQPYLQPYPQPPPHPHPQLPTIEPFRRHYSLRRKRGGNNHPPQQQQD